MHNTHEKRHIGPVRLVIADLAGTTLDYGSRAPAGAFIELFRRYGMTATTYQARGPMGLHKRDHIREMLHHPDLAAQWAAGHNGDAWTEDDVEAMFREFIPLQLGVLPQFTEMIPGAADTFQTLRDRGIALAATTGYNREMTDLVLEAAARQGYRPDVALCAAEVAAGRPAPWMIYRCMEATGVYPLNAVVKVGDTVSDVEAGVNAGVWSVGVAKTGNMLGLDRTEVEALTDKDLEERLVVAREALTRAGAFAVIDSISELPNIINHIETRTAGMGHPCAVRK